MLSLMYGLPLLMKKNDWPPAPLILGFILGDMFEGAFRQSLSMSKGSFMIFFNRPIAAVFILLTVVSVFLMARFLRRIPKKVLVEDD
jgi:putative tricarboxylic transport membrane protein